MINFTARLLVIKLFLILPVCSFSHHPSLDDDDPFKYLSYTTDVYFQKDKKGEVNVIYSEEISITAQSVSNLKFIKPLYFDERSYITRSKVKLGSNRYRSIDLVKSDVEQNGIFHSDLQVAYLEHQFKRVGEVVRFKYEKVYTDLRFLPPIFLRHEYDCDVSEVTISKEDWMTFRVEQLNMDAIKQEMKTEDGEEFYSYMTESQKAFSSKNNAPPSPYYSPHVFIIPERLPKRLQTKNPYISNTDELYKTYKSLVDRCKNDITPLKGFVDELTAGKTKEEQAKAIYYWVQDNIRYIAFEFDLMGFIPEPSHKVYNNKYGDCKGMANLTKHMLKSVGMDARLAWIGTHDKPYDYSLPSFYVDNHMICALIMEGDTIFLDATEKEADFNEYADRIADRPVMIEDGDNYALAKIPIKGKEENKKNLNLDCTIESDQFLVEGNLELFGNYKTFLYQRIRKSNEKEKMDYLKRYLSFSRDEDVQLQSDFELKRDQSINLSYSSIRQNLVTELDNEMYFHPEPNGGSFFKEFEESRSEPYTFGGVVDLEYNYSIKIPEGYRINYLPESVIERNEYYEITASLTQTDSEIKYIRKIKNHRRLVPSSEFENWNKVAKSVKEFYNNQIVLSKK